MVVDDYDDYDDVCMRMFISFFLGGGIRKRDERKKNLNYVLEQCVGVEKYLKST